MKILLSTAVVIAATLSVGGMRTAGAEECAGPFRQCAISVSATCDRNSDGRQRMTYYDHPGNVVRFETCVGRIFEAAGQPNPYTTAPARMTGARSGRPAGGAGLSVPDSELLYPTVDF